MGFFNQFFNARKKDSRYDNGMGNGYSVRMTPEISDMLSGSQNFFNLNDVSLYVNRGISKRAEKIGQIEFKLYKGEQEVEESPFLDLLDKPNDHQTGDTFWALVSTYKDISGFAVIRMITDNPNGEPVIFRDMKNVKSLEVMNSSKVIKNYDGTNKIVSFTETLDNGSQLTVPFDECIYWIKPDPKRPTEGLSLLRAGLYSIDTDNQLSIYQNAVIKNGGSTDTIITFEQDITETQKDEMRQAHIKERRNPSDQDVPIYLGGGARAERLGLTPSELAYLETKKIYGRDMVIITGVPLSILGITSDETFANGEVAYRVFLRETIKPICDDLVNILNWKLIPAEYELCYEDPSPEDVDTKIKKVNALYATDSSTINERREILDMERYEDPKADEIMVSFAKRPLNYEEPAPMTLSIKKTMTKSPACRKKDETKEECVARKIPELIGEGMKQDQAVAVANSVCSISCDNKACELTETNHILRDKGFRDMYRKVMMKRMDKKEAQFVSVIRDYFSDQEKRIIAGINDEAKAFEVKALVDDVLNEGLEIRIAKGAVLPLLRKYLIEAGKETTDLLDAENGFEMSSAIEKWLNNRAGLFAKEITATTYDKLKREFTESFDKGETRQQLVKRVEGVYANFDENRAKVIARTEVHGSTQKGNFEGSKQAGSTIKIWVSVMDDRTRDSHAYLDGEEVGINDEFSNGLKFAGDPSGEASETINCRCMTI